MSDKEHNFLRMMFESRDKQLEKGKLVQEDVKKFQEIARLKEEIVTNVKAIVDSNFPPILARLDQIQKMLLAIGAKVDISDLEKEVLTLLKNEVGKKK